MPQQLHAQLPCSEFWMAWRCWRWAYPFLSGFPAAPKVGWRLFSARRNVSTYLSIGRRDMLNRYGSWVLGFTVFNGRHQTVARSRLCDREEYKDILTTVGCHRLIFDLDVNLFHPGDYQIKIDCSLLNRKKITRRWDLGKIWRLCSNSFSQIWNGRRKRGHQLRQPLGCVASEGDCWLWRDFPKSL